MMMMMIFWFWLNRGFNQIKGSIKGPTVKKSNTSQFVLKYHLPCSFIVITSTFSKNSPQCLHFIASSWISSAQYGHFFIINLLIPNLLIILQTKTPAPSNTIRQLSQPPVIYRTFLFSKNHPPASSYISALAGALILGLFPVKPDVASSSLVDPAQENKYHTSLNKNLIIRWGFLFHIQSYLFITYP